MLIGYARTSTEEQKAGIEAQLRDLKVAGVEKIFHEQISSRSMRRPQFEACMDYIRDGDILIVTKPDRLARSTYDLLNIAKALEEKKAGLIILSMGKDKLDTTTPTGKLMLTLLAAIAEFERDLMLERQREGIARAKNEGKYTGRKPSVGLKTEEVKTLLNQGMNKTEIARQLNMSRMTVYRILKGNINI